MAEKSVSSKPKEGSRKCEACAITLPDIYAYVDHLESKEHTKGLMKKKYGEKYLEAKANLGGQKVDKDVESDDDKSGSSSDEDNVYTCEVCRKVCTGILNYKLHLSGKSHAKKVKNEKLLKQMKKETYNFAEDGQLVDGLFSNQSDSADIFCKVCNKKCSGPESFKQHIKSESHKKKLKMQSLISGKSSSRNPASDDSDDDKDEEHVRCEVCCKEFSGPLPYRQHMESPVHLKQVKLSDQLVKLKDLGVSSEDSNQIQCKECNKSFNGVKPFNDHIKSSLHAKLKQKKDLLSTLKEKYPEMMFQQTSVSDSENSEDEGPNIFCSVCHTVFTGPESARDHFQSQKHQKVMKEKMKRDKYKKMKNGKKSKPKAEEEEKNNSSDGFDIIE